MSALGSVARRAAASIHGFLVESVPPIAATHGRERGSGSELKPAEPERTPEPPVILTTAIGASGGAAALAAAVGVASAGGAEGRCALLIDVEPPPRPPRPTVLASASARELEERIRALGGHFGAAAARGNLCYLPLSAGEDPLRAVAELVAAGRCPPRRSSSICRRRCGRAAIADPRLRARSGLLRADLPADRALAALAVRRAARAGAAREARRPIRSGGWPRGAPSPGSSRAAPPPAAPAGWLAGCSPASRARACRSCSARPPR